MRQAGLLKLIKGEIVMLNWKVRVAVIVGLALLCLGIALADDGDTVTVSFDVNGGSYSMASQQTPAGSAFTLPDCYFRPPEYQRFSAWQIGSDAENLKAPGDSIIVTEDTVVKAVWGYSLWGELQRQTNTYGYIDHYLQEDLTAAYGESAIVIPANHTFYLDLNGHTISRGASSAQRDAVFEVNGTLIIEDTVGGGQITGAFGSGAIVSYSTSGVFILRSGSITGNIVGNGAVYMPGGTFVMEGGAITGNQCMYNGITVKTLRMSGGGITDNTGGFMVDPRAAVSAGVRVMPGCTFEISGDAVISGNVIGTRQANVFLDEGSVMTVKGSLTGSVPVGVTAAADVATVTSGLAGHGDLSRFACDASDCAALLSGEGEAVLVHKLTASGADMVLPADTESIGDRAFEGTDAATVWIPDGCTLIGEEAFRNSSLVLIRIPAGCAVGSYAFADCGTVYIISAANSPAAAYCAAHDNCVLVEE